MRRGAGLESGIRHLMTVFQGAVDAKFAAFGSMARTLRRRRARGVRAIARRSDTIVGFGETRIHAEAATFEPGGARPQARDPATN